MSFDPVDRLRGNCFRWRADGCREADHITPAPRADKTASGRRSAAPARRAGCVASTTPAAGRGPFGQQQCRDYHGRSAEPRRRLRGHGQNPSERAALARQCAGFARHCGRLADLDAAFDVARLANSDAANSDVLAPYSNSPLAAEVPKLG